MIVLSNQKGWKIINQRSHGLLAAMIAYQYNIDLSNDILVPTLIAIAEHDDGVAETREDKNLTDAGAPRNFTVGDSAKKADIKQKLNVMEMASAKSQLNALLTSRHIDFIYSDTDEASDKKLKKFLKDQAINRSNILKNLNINKDFAQRLYRFVEWCDAFSLLICLDKIQPEGRRMEISESPDGDVNQTFYLEENVISVEPWPFKEDNFKVFYEYKIIEQLQFKNIEEFDLICMKTQVHREEFILKRN